MYRSNEMRKRLLIADDHELILEGLCKLLASEYEIVGSVTNGRAVVVEATRLNPDIVVLDIGMPELNGVEATRQIAALLPKAKLIVLTQQLDPSYVQAAFRAGAHAYVSKQSASTELLMAIRTALIGHYYVTPLAVSKASELLKTSVYDTNPIDLFGTVLTPRQREVLQLVAEGKSAKEIATALNISTKTVEFHKNSLMDELGVRTTAELTRYAIMQGILAVDGRMKAE